MEGSVYKFAKSMAVICEFTKIGKIFHEKYPSLDKEAGSGNLIIALTAIGGLAGGGAVGTSRALSELNVDPRYKRMREEKRVDYKKNQLLSGFMDGALKGGVSVPVVVKFLQGKIS